MTPEHRAEIEKIRATSANRALDIIRVTMPRKVIELTELLAVCSFPSPVPMSAYLLIGSRNVGVDICILFFGFESVSCPLIAM